MFFFPFSISCAVAKEKKNSLERFEKSIFLCIYLFVIPQWYCSSTVIQSPCRARQNLIPHTFTSFQVLKNESIVLILNSYFCLFIFSQRLILRCSFALLKKQRVRKRQQHRYFRCRPVCAASLSCSSAA